MSVPAVRFRNLVKQYDKRQILTGISLDVAAGECFGLVGMNGAGKTTMLKCLLDFCEYDSGAIDIFGVSSRRTEARLPLAFVPERFTPPYYLSGQDFLKYVLTLQNIEYDRTRAEQMLDALDFDAAALRRAVRSYSKGMTQKLGLAASFLTDKKLYVLDEPMSGLDPKARTLLKAHLNRIRMAGGTLFFSSHALADIEEICDRMAILHHGALRFVGSPAECRQQHAAQTLEQAYMSCIAA
jgi:ABC-2 type transport system ATP-binding protein